jgi:hypothetical protein
MAKRVVSSVAQSWTAATDATAVGAASTGFIALKGGSTTQIVDLLEFLISGMASNSAVFGGRVAYSSTLGATPTTPPALPNSDGPMIVNATALAATVVAYTAATTGPIPNAANTLPRLSLALNAFGGIIRWNAAPTQQWTQIGNAVNAGESVLYNSSSASGVTTVVNAHIIYEPY